MNFRPGAAPVARLAVLTTLLLGTLMSSATSAAPLCRHPHGPRCVAAQRAERSARRAAHWAAVRVAPTLSADGNTLSWSAVPGIDTYVVIRIVPGKPRERHVVTGTSFTPHETPGATAEYRVRTHVARSHFSEPVSISYAVRQNRHSQHTEGGSGSTPGSGSGSAPVSGSGTETPPSGSGTTPVSGSETPTSEPTHNSSGFETGVVPTTETSTEPGTVKALGAHSVRMEFPIGAPASALAADVEAYARVGIRLLPLAGFYAKIPSAGEARNLASWAQAYGPHGTFWAGKPYPEVPVTAIEFGNETSYTYQFSDNSPSGLFNRGAAYATRFAEAESAMASVSSVGLLAQADDGGTGSPAWVNGMFSAVPNLGSIVAGWTVHPYGPTWQRKLDALVSTTAAKGAPSSIPIYVTELGISVDNGHCVEENYGWNPCMSDSEAASTLTGVVTGMRTRYGSRLRALYLYQAQDQKPEGATNNRENYFGLLQSNGATKGAFTAAVISVLSSGTLAAVRPAAHAASVHVASFRAERRHRARAARLARAARRRRG